MDGHSPKVGGLPGQPVAAEKGESVAAVLLRQTQGWCRTTPVSQTPRAPYCMMGVCFECLVEIDGVPARQSCLVAVRDGMQVRRQIGAAGLDNVSFGEKE